MATAPTATTVKTPPAPPAVQAGIVPPASTAGGPPQRRPFRPLSPSEIQLTEYAVHSFEITLAAGVPFEDVLQPAFFSNIPQAQAQGQQGIRPGDRIHVHSATGAFYGVVYVRHVSQAKPIAGIKGGVVCAALSYHEFERLDTNPKPPTHEIRFRGPSGGYAIVRLGDEKIVVQNLDTEEDAKQHLIGMVRAGLA